MVQAGGFQVVIDPQVWYKLKQDLDKADKELARSLRRRIKNAGQVAAEAVKKKLAEGGGAGGATEYAGDIADLLAAATRTTVSFTARNAGVKIATSNRLIAESDKGLLKAYNRTTFRHPVWPRGTNRRAWKWVDQKAEPFFDDPIQKVADTVFMAEVQAAIDDAFDQLRERYQ